MSIAISSSLSVASSASANSSSNSAAVQQPQPSVNASADTVHLTVAQQVYQLYNQGQTVSQIASGLSLSVEMVNSYLGISSSSS